jgi:hypothetical protein
MSPHGNICCDPAYSPLRDPQTLQQVHFRPGAPYPRIVLIVGKEPYPYPLPPPEVRKVSSPTQAGRFTIRGPSATGPWTYRGPWNFAHGTIGSGGQAAGLT